MMGKAQEPLCVLYAPQPQQKRQPLWRARPVVTAIVAGLLLGFLVLRQLSDLGRSRPNPLRNAKVNPFEDANIWTTLESQPQLEYQECYGHFQCARLEVPLEWRNESNPARVGVAVIRSPARVPIDDPRYAGPIILNPGGPGGSGVAIVIGLADKLRIILDTDDKAYDIVSFDPRGVGYTDPPLVCFDQPLYEQNFGERLTDTGIPHSSDTALAQYYALAKGLGGACEPYSRDSIKHHLTTPSVASDMLALVEAHGAWRQAEIHGRVPSDFDPKKEMLQYWGFSYGTLLGGTFASLYPDRVGRVVLDGVVDSDDYYSTEWMANLFDTEAVLDGFYDGCAAAGVSICPLAKHGKTGKDLRQALDDALDMIKNKPIPIVSHHAGSILTWSEVKSIIFQILYSPIGFQALSYFVDEVVQSANSTISSGAPRYVIDGQSKAHGLEASLHILCSDGDSRANQTIADVERRIPILLKQSPLAGELWVQLAMGCGGVTVRSPWTFDRSTYGANKTANPVLFVGNTADPVTPLANAHLMSKKFAGSGVLQQDGIGHCSIAQYSRCSTSRIREYFATGKLPPKGTVCPVDWHPFDPPDAIEQAIKTQSADMRDERAARAHIELQQRFWKESGGALGQFALSHHF